MQELGRVVELLVHPGLAVAVVGLDSALQIGQVVGRGQLGDSVALRHPALGQRRLQVVVQGLDHHVGEHLLHAAVAHGLAQGLRLHIVDKVLVDHRVIGLGADERLSAVHGLLVGNLLAHETVTLRVHDDAAQQHQAQRLVRPAAGTEGEHGRCVEVGTAILVAAQRERLAHLALRRERHGDARALAGRIAHGHHARSGEVLGHHVLVAEKAAGAQADGLRIDVDGLPVLSAAHADNLIAVEDKLLGRDPVARINAGLVQGGLEDVSAFLALAVVGMAADLAEGGAGQFLALGQLHHLHR